MDLFAEEETGRILSLSDHDDEATLIGLSGELGAGKTAFVKSLGKSLHILESIPSPTFVIARFYDIPKHPRFTRLIHIDAYRIEDEEELRPLGWTALLRDSKNLILVEWPEKIPQGMNRVARTLRFEDVDETTRIIRA